VAVWERGRLLPATPDLLTDRVERPGGGGTEEQILELDTLLVIYDVNYNPVLVIGGGKVGTAAAGRCGPRARSPCTWSSATRRRGGAEGIPDRVFVGDAADREVLHEAGLAAAPSVVLTTNDDATNIYLSVYCRRLNPELRIVSRITHERNVEAIHRAGADFALSYASLGVETVSRCCAAASWCCSAEGVEFFALTVPKSLAGRTLAEARSAAAPAST
jgi:voltage-gated potassium channel